MTSALSGIFWVSSGAEIWPLSQWDLDDFLLSLLLFSFNLMAIVCAIANLFLN